MKFQNLSIVFAIGVTMAMTACHHHYQQEGHAHDEMLQLTAYSDRFEVYAQAEPFVAGTESESLRTSLFSIHSNPWKPVR